LKSYRIIDREISQASTEGSCQAQLPSVPCIKFLGMLLMGGPSSTVVVTCHFDVCKWEMLGELNGHWSRAVSCLLIRTTRVHIN